MLRYITNSRISEYLPVLSDFTDEEAEKVNSVHSLIEGFSPTPLRSLENMAADLGVRKIFVKDESFRLGLNAFKVLGAGYAAVKYFSEKYNIPTEELTMENIRKISSDKDITLITATDGNHGRAVAYIARILGMKSIIYMPKGSSKERYDLIASEGADVTVTDVNYDGAVLLAKKKAEENGYVFIQDTAMEGYTDIPLYIMQGYMNILRETAIQMGEEVPTHVFLQAGVGSFAGSMLAYMVNHYENYPRTVILEPKNANCVYMSKANGRPYEVTGDLETIMAGLSCGVASTIALEVLMNYADMFVSLDDEFARVGMNKLYHAKAPDPVIISGESGAVGMGFLYEVMTKEEYSTVKDILGLDKNSVVLIISTEGDTDKASFKSIVRI